MNVINEAETESCKIYLCQCCYWWIIGSFSL